MNVPRTEMRNPKSMNMDKMSTEDMARLVITANYEAVKAAEDAVSDIARAVDAIAEAFDCGHRLVYIGAGTSGRLGIIDDFFDDVKRHGITEIRERRPHSVTKRIMKESPYMHEHSGYKLYYIMQ